MASQFSSYFPNISSIRNIELSHTAKVALINGIGIVAAFCFFVYTDYSEWIKMGTGGTPPTPSGYWRMTKLRWRAFRSGNDMRDTSSLADAKGPKLLTQDLAQRQGERPLIVGRTMPQRQELELLDQKVRDRLRGLPSKYCLAYPDILELDLSKTEGRSTDAIYAKPNLPGRDPSAKDKILGNEITHVHPADNSLHVWLSGPDAKVVIDKGWGERFPLSAMGMCHPSWIMLYAPRNMDEVDVIEDIIKAGVQYLTGVKV